MFHCVLPHYQFDSVLELTPDKLRELGLNNLLLDVDCTLKPYSLQEVSDEIRQWLQLLKEEKIGLCLVSNGRGARIQNFAKSVELPYVATAMKPLRRGCLRAMQTHHFESKKTAIVGDQLFADVWAGHNAGIVSILVRPIHPEEEPWFTQLKRMLEKVVFWCNSSKMSWN